MELVSWTRQNYGADLMEIYTYKRRWSGSVDNVRNCHSSAKQKMTFLDYFYNLKHSKCHIFNYKDKTGVAVMLYTCV